MKSSLTIFTNISANDKLSVATCIRLALMAGLMLLSFPSFGQTSIVIIKTRQDVLIGADTKVRRFETTGKEATSVSTCKIKQFGGVFVAAAGLVEDTNTGFNIYEAAKSAVEQGGHIAEQALRFENAIGYKLVAEVDSIRRDDPKRFEVLKTADVLTITFAGLEAGTPSLTFVSFNSSLTPRGAIQINAHQISCPGEVCGIEPAIFFMGDNKAALAYEAKHEKFWLSNPTAAIRKLIGIEIVDRPEDVGPPIDIVRITKNGARWIQKKPECKDVGVR